MQLKNEQSDPLSTLRTQVRQEIKKKYPTVERFCFENDIKKSTLSRLLSGKRKEFKIKTLKRIGHALNRAIEIRLKIN